jgi:hypothetical protein
MDIVKLTNFFEENGFVVKESSYLSFRKKVFNSMYPNIKRQEASLEVMYINENSPRPYLVLDVFLGYTDFARIKFWRRESRKEEENKIILRYFDLLISISNVYFILFDYRNHFYAERKRKDKLVFSAYNNLNMKIDEEEIDRASFEHESNLYEFNNLYEFYKKYVPGYFQE